MAALHPPRRGRCTRGAGAPRLRQAPARPACCRPTADRRHPGRRKRSCPNKGRPGEDGGANQGRGIPPPSPPPPAALTRWRPTGPRPTPAAAQQPPRHECTPGGHAGDNGWKADARPPHPPPPPPPPPPLQHQPWRRRARPPPTPTTPAPVSPPPAPRAEPARMASAGGGGGRGIGAAGKGAAGGAGPRGRGGPALGPGLGHSPGPSGFFDFYALLATRFSLRRQLTGRRGTGRYACFRAQN